MLKQYMMRCVSLGIAAVAVLGSSPLQAGELVLSDTPLFLQPSVAPLNMLVVGRDHKLYYEAYNDASDLNGDGKLDVGYKGYLTGKEGIDYYGYFDSYKCYTYNTDKFVPARFTTTKKCGGTDEWSGDYLNYLTMSRIDALRKVLYGGKRETDSKTETILDPLAHPDGCAQLGQGIFLGCAHRIQYPRLHAIQPAGQAAAPSVRQHHAERPGRELGEQHSLAPPAGAEGSHLSHLGMGEQGKPGGGHRGGAALRQRQGDLRQRIPRARRGLRHGSDPAGRWRQDLGDMQAISQGELQAGRLAARVRREQLDDVRPAHRLVHREQERRRTAQERRLDHRRDRSRLRHAESRRRRHHQDARCVPRRWLHTLHG